MVRRIRILVTVAACCLAPAVQAFNPPADTAGRVTVKIEAPAEITKTDTPVPARIVLENGGDIEASADVIREMKATQWMDGELAAFATNTVARKSEQLRRGPVSETIIKATEGVRTNAIVQRASAPMTISMPARI